MRKYVFLNTILIIIITLVMGTYNSCFATTADTKKYDITSNEFVKNWKKGDGTFVNEASKPITDLIVFIVNKVLGIIQIFTGMLMVLCITYTGFNMVLSNNPEVAHDIGLDIGASSGKNPTIRKRILDNLRRILIGTIFAFSSTTLVKIAFNLFMSF